MRNPVSVRSQNGCVADLHISHRINGDDSRSVVDLPVFLPLVSAKRKTHAAYATDL